MSRRKTIKRRKRTVGQPPPAIPHVSAIDLLTQLEYHDYPESPWRVSLSIQETTEPEAFEETAIEDTGTLIGISNSFEDYEHNLYFYPVLEVGADPVLRFRTYRHRSKYHEKYQELYNYTCDAYAKQEDIYDIHQRESFPALGLVVSQLRRAVRLNPDAGVYISNPIQDDATPIVGVCFEPESATVILRASPSGWLPVPETEEKREAVEEESPNLLETPKPINTKEVVDLLSGFSLKQRAVCALVAAEMVLPQYKLRHPYDFSLQEAVSLTKGLIEGKSKRPTVQVVINSIYQKWALQGPPNDRYVAMAVTYAGSTALETDEDLNLDNAVAAVEYARWAAESFLKASPQEFYGWWWGECSRVLGIEGQETARLTTQGAEEYEVIRRGLEPREQKLIPSLFTKRECDPPEDPDWPAPTNREDTEALLKRLPHRSQVICALIAAELVLPIWESQWEPGSPEIDLRPREAIEVTWRWLNGEATLEEVQQAGNDAWDAAAWLAAGTAARAAARAAAWAANWAAGAADEAGWMPIKEFYELWWKECRCRLALEQPGTMEPQYYG